MSDHHEKTDPMAFDTEIISVTDPDYCPTSKRVDGPKHSWVFDGDDPYVICCYCGQRRDNLTGRIVGETPERAEQILRDAGWPMTDEEAEAMRGDFAESDGPPNDGRKWVSSNDLTPMQIAYAQANAGQRGWDWYVNADGLGWAVLPRKKCTNCYGKGKVPMSASDCVTPGRFGSDIECGACRGTGWEHVSNIEGAGR